ALCPGQGPEHGQLPRDRRGHRPAGNPRLAAARTQLRATGVVAGRDQTVCGYLVVTASAPGACCARRSPRGRGSYPDTATILITGNPGKGVGRAQRITCVAREPVGAPPRGERRLKAAHNPDLPPYPHHLQIRRADRLVTGNDQQAIT